MIDWGAVLSGRRKVAGCGIAVALVGDLFAFSLPMEGLRHIRSRLDQIAQRRGDRNAVFDALKQGALPGVRSAEAHFAEAPPQPDKSGYEVLGLTEVTRPEGSFGFRRVVVSTTQLRSRYSLGPRLDTVALREPIPSGALPHLAKGTAVSGAGSPTVAYLDTETSGLAGGSGTVAFLVGIGFWERTPQDEGWQFILEQYFARDFCNEGALLHAVAERLGNFDYVCTYNGRTFDMPILRARGVLNRIPPRAFALPNLDLLHFSRRLWRKVLPNCSLKCIEKNILCIDRGPDVGGAEIPELWFEATRSGNLTPLAPVLHHHGQDIVTLGTLLWLLGEIIEEPLACCHLRHSGEWVGIARWFESQKNFTHAAAAMEAALRCHQGTDRGEERELLYRLAALRKRAGDYAGAMELWEELASTKSPIADRAIIELAKIKERVLRDYEGALAWVEKQLSRRQLARELSKWLEADSQQRCPVTVDLEKRRLRLQVRIEKQKKKRKRSV